MRHAAFAPRRLLVGPVLLSLAALPGCGNTPSPPPVVTTPSAVSKMVPESLPAQGISFTAPAGWHYALGQAPLLATVNSGLVIASQIASGVARMNTWCTFVMFWVIVVILSPPALS